MAFVSMLSLPACAEKRLVCTMEVDLVQEPLGWVGTLEGDISGTISIVENPATFPGTTEHFDESFTITTDDGDVLVGGDTGVFNLKMFKAVANGAITDASSPEWEWIVGYGLHFSGTADLTVNPWHFSGTVMFMPP